MVMTFELHQEITKRSCDCRFMDPRVGKTHATLKKKITFDLFIFFSIKCLIKPEKWLYKMEWFLAPRLNTQ